jgi:hypothetical protein
VIPAGMKAGLEGTGLIASTRRSENNNECGSVSPDREGRQSE